MSNRAVDLSVKQRLQRAIDRPLSADWPSELHRDLLAEIERLEECIRAMTAAANYERSRAHNLQCRVDIYEAGLKGMPTR